MEVKTKRRKLYRNIIVITVVTSIVWLMFRGLFYVFRVDGGSMLPTLSDNDYAFTNRIVLQIDDIERFDIIVYRNDINGAETVKRVIAMPNETIMYRDDKLYIDGIYVVEPFLDMTFIASQTLDNILNFTDDFGPITLGSNEYFVLGDNRLISKDSRTQGTVNIENIIGKDIFIFYPFNK
ncbi:MAG: signal peptidase I [Coprobacillaceae bacterium]